MSREIIRTRAQVESLRTVQEGPTIDYKIDADPKNLGEHGKDIGAFANHLGGDILVGVDETADNRAIPGGLPAARIALIEKAYENAYKDNCRPQPLVTFDSIPWDDGRFILAVHVEAHPTGLVGAKFYAKNQVNELAATAVWQYVVRKGRHNIELTPDQIPMFMIPSIRRAVVLLEAIPPEKRRDSVTLLYRPRDNRDFPHPRPMELVSVDPLKNIFRLAIQASKGAGMEYLQVPLDDVEAVWEDFPDHWAIRISGFIDRHENGTRYQSLPRSSAPP